MTKSDPPQPRLKSPRTAADARLLRCEHLAKSYAAMDRVTVAHRTYAGGEQVVTRDVFMGFRAATVTPYDPATGRVLMVEQFRAAPYAMGDACPWVLEPVAGMIDPGETPEQAALREAREEAGLEIGRLIPIGAYYPATGFLAEHLTSFIGLADLSNAGGVHGLVEEGEDIRVVTATLDEALAAVASGDINVGPLILALYWLAANKSTLL